MISGHNLDDINERSFMTMSSSPFRDIKPLTLYLLSNPVIVIVFIGEKYICI